MREITCGQIWKNVRWGGSPLGYYIVLSNNPDKTLWNVGEMMRPGWGVNTRSRVNPAVDLQMYDFELNECIYVGCLEDWIDDKKWTRLAEKEAHKRAGRVG